jgi:putative tryptophan/tyrosine transport system permease protein
MDLLDNALLQGLSYAAAVIGVTLAFRVVRYPDLTADGSFLLGATIYAALLTLGTPWALAAAVACGGGALAGCFTGLLSAGLGVHRLLSGILTSMICYSIAFRILGGRSNLGLWSTSSVWTEAARWDLRWAPGGVLHPASIALAGVVIVILTALVYLLLRSDLGLVLRAVGSNELMVEGLGRHTASYRILGLSVANGLVALSGTMLASTQGFVDVNMGAGIVIVFIAALVMGEEAVRRFGPPSRTGLGGQLAAPLIGVLLYFCLYLAMLRASIRGWLHLQFSPTDLKMLSAVLIIAVFVVRSRSARGQVEKVLPL